MEISEFLIDNFNFTDLQPNNLMFSPDRNFSTNYNLNDMLEKANIQNGQTIYVKKQMEQVS